MSSKKGRLIIISAPSGTGKTTICDRLLKILPQSKRSVSYTTRPIRTGEIEGLSYFFVNEEEFERLKEKGALAEWATVHGSQYGTSTQFIERALEGGEDIIFNIDVQGAESLKSKFPEAITIFLLPPSMDELERRLRGRQTESEHALRTRLQTAIEEMAQKEKFDHIVTNETIDRALDEILTLLGERIGD